MAKNPSEPEWAPPPERRVRDLPSRSNSAAADGLREILVQKAIPALVQNVASCLVFPPVKSRASRDDRFVNSDLHHNRYVEVGIVTGGIMNLWWEGYTTICPEGTVFVIAPGMYYRPHAEAPGRAIEPHSVIWLALHRGCAVIHGCRLKGDSHHLSEYHSFNDAQVTPLARSLAQEIAERAPLYETAVRGALICLMTILARAPAQPIAVIESAGEPAEEPSDDPFTAQVKTYLRSHYHRPLTLNKVASSVGCSPAHLCRRFRESTGVTPFRYLRTLRVEAAKQLLLSEVPIARVAEMVGIDDPFYFSRVFSADIGISPQAYRARERPNAGTSADDSISDFFAEI